METERITLLIVEDHEVSLNGLKNGLAACEDIDVVGTAADSDSGLQMAKQLRPDVVLLDLHLPGNNGPRSMVKEFCKLIGSRIVVFSVEQRSAFVEAIMDLGPAGYLLKSESIATVAATIRKVMSIHKPVLSSELSEAIGTKLTASEQQVLRMLARGMKYQNIADLRHTTPGTIRKQCEMLILKLGLETREELIAWAVENGYGRLDL